MLILIDASPARRRRLHRTIAVACLACAVAGYLIPSGWFL